MFSIELCWPLLAALRGPEGEPNCSPVAFFEVWTELSSPGLVCALGWPTPCGRDTAYFLSCDPR
jgi:hypothetical protein